MMITKQIENAIRSRMGEILYKIIDVETIDDKNYKVSIEIFNRYPNKKIFLIEFKSNQQNLPYSTVQSVLKFNTLEPTINLTDNNGKEILITGKNFSNDIQFPSVVYFYNYLPIFNSITENFNNTINKNLIKISLPAQSNLGTDKNSNLYGVFNVTVVNSQESTEILTSNQDIIGIEIPPNLPQVKNVSKLNEIITFNGKNLNLVKYLMMVDNPNLNKDWIIPISTNNSELKLTLNSLINNNYYNAILFTNNNDVIGIKFKLNSSELGLEPNNLECNAFCKGFDNICHC